METKADTISGLNCRPACCLSTKIFNHVQYLRGQKIIFPNIGNHDLDIGRMGCDKLFMNRPSPVLGPLFGTDQDHQMDIMVDRHTSDGWGCLGSRTDVYIDSQIGKNNRWPLKYRIADHRV